MEFIYRALFGETPSAPSGPAPAGLGDLPVEILQYIISMLPRPSAVAPVSRLMCLCFKGLADRSLEPCLADLAASNARLMSVPSLARSLSGDKFISFLKDSLRTSAAADTENPSAPPVRAHPQSVTLTRDLFDEHISLLETLLDLDKRWRTGQIERAFGQFIQTASYYCRGTVERLCVSYISNCTGRKKDHLRALQRVRQIEHLLAELTLVKATIYFRSTNAHGKTTWAPDYWWSATLEEKCKRGGGNAQTRLAICAMAPAVGPIMERDVHGDGRWDRLEKNRLPEMTLGQKAAHWTKVAYHSTGGFRNAWGRKEFFLESEIKTATKIELCAVFAGKEPRFKRFAYYTNVISADGARIIRPLRFDEFDGHIHTD